MSTCARCGEDDCEAEWGRKEALACRDRELANLRSLLRSVTGKLEEAGYAIRSVGSRCSNTDRVKRLIDSVLEILS